jgi:SAM-dependent methyltransferase
VNAITDERTADAFASSWNTVGRGSVYTRDQFLEWFAPLEPRDIEGKRVLELGFGNGSILYHVADCRPSHLTGVELGDTFDTARRNLQHVPDDVLELIRGDLTTVDAGSFDLVYCIGVLHHLQRPEEGFAAVLRHVRPGGRFHCWVYAREGNAVVIALVDPIRKVAARLPWWLTKYGLALPLVIPYFFYAKGIQLAGRGALGRFLSRFLPLYHYSLWIAPRNFRFFHHVAFDQLVTPATLYITREEVERWLSDSRIDPASTYVIWRNQNSWKFGGIVRPRESGG